jgi:hypothetical protein
MNSNEERKKPQEAPTDIQNDIPYRLNGYKSSLPINKPKVAIVEQSKSHGIFNICKINH